MANSTGIEQKLLLVLDCSPVGSGHLKAAVNFAACLGLPIEALLVEDVNLTRLVRSASRASTIVACQLNSHTVRGGRISGEQIERELKIHARKIERKLGELAATARVECSFRTVRGVVEDEVRAAAASADLIALWGARRPSTALAESVAPAANRLSPLRLVDHQKLTPRQIAAPRRQGLPLISSDVILINCHSRSFGDRLLLELIGHTGRRTIFLTG